MAAFDEPSSGRRWQLCQRGGRHRSVLLTGQKFGYITHTAEYKSVRPDKSAAEKMSVKWLKIIGSILIKRGM
jgi:hypothetical protein